MASRIATKRMADVCVGLFVIAATAHFAHRGLQGESGVFVRIVAEKELERRKDERIALSEERARLENLTLRLSEAYLDLELLDEQVRAILGHLGADEVVIR